MSMLLLCFTCVVAIWPPPYQINLNQDEEFVISELWEDDDDEMIKKDDIMKRSMEESEKYLRIHQMANRLNKKELNNVFRIENKMKERNFDQEELPPWQAGFVDGNDNFIQPDSRNVYFINEMATSLINNKTEEKRENKQETVDTTYDYLNFKDEYNAEINKAKTEKNVLNFTEVKEDESLKDAVDTIKDFQPKNCTEKDKQGIGFVAIKCLIKEKGDPKIILKKILIKVLIWFLVYLVIAIPCWCQRGWCCCCFRCKYCKPRQVIEEAKQFHINNPPGIYYEENEKFVYTPTEYEKYSQRKLEKALMTL